MERLLLLVMALLAAARAQAPGCGRTPIPPDCGSGSGSGNGTESNLIVGGQTAKPYSWPWQAMLCTIGWFTCNLHCGATVLANGWVMTAGHCVYNHTPSDYFVRVGIFDHDKVTEIGGTIHGIDNIYLHPKYQHYPDPEYDVAILKVDPLITFSDHVQPVCLPSEDADVVIEPNTAWVTGWGTTKGGGQFSSTLQQVQVPFVNAEECSRAYGDLDSKIMVCAGKQGYDSCQGDSGGPLTVVSGDVWYQYGITSFGHGCAENGYPGVYGRVSAFCDWIRGVTFEQVLCHARQ